MTARAQIAQQSPARGRPGPIRGAPGVRGTTPLDHDHRGHVDRRRRAAASSSCCLRSTGSATRRSGSTASPMPASSCCWRSASTSWWALAGLLDLGYAAFFAIGAYAYAYGASSFTGLDIPFWIMLLLGALIAAVFGILLGAPTLRLRGDYLAIVTLGFGEIVPVVFKNGRQVDERDERHLRSSAGLRLPRRHLRRHPVVALLRRHGSPDHSRHDPAVSATGFAARPLLASHPRG